MSIEEHNELMEKKQELVDGAFVSMRERDRLRRERDEARTEIRELKKQEAAGCDREKAIRLEIEAQSKNRLLEIEA